MVPRRTSLDPHIRFYLSLCHPQPTVRLPEVTAVVLNNYMHPKMVFWQRIAHVLPVKLSYEHRVVVSISNYMWGMVPGLY